MSATQPDLSLDSGSNHLKPALVAIAIAVATTIATLVLTGLPH